MALKSQLIIPLPQSTNDDLCNSSKRLSLIFDGDIDLIKSYDVKRKLLKKFPNDHLYKREYGYIVAQIEIKLSHKQTELEKQLTSIERHQLVTKQSLNLIPTNSVERAEYKSIIHILQSINNIKHEL